MGMIKLTDSQIAICLAAFVAAISWIIKGLLEKPFINSRDTFFRYAEKRISILSKARARLLLISYFPNNEGKIFKEQLQSILLNDSEAPYFSSNIFGNILRISIDKDTNEEIVISTLKEIDSELAILISKIKSETNFFITFSNQNPYKRIVSFLFLLFSYCVAVLLSTGILGMWLYFIIVGHIITKVILSILGIISLYQLNKQLKGSNSFFR